MRGGPKKITPEGALRGGPKFYQAAKPLRGGLKFMAAEQPGWSEIFASEAAMGG